jgi:fucose permease
MEYFWKWTRFRDYCLFLTMFWVVGCILTFLLVRVTVFVELLGLLALLSEACLGLPQVWKNYSNQSTAGMR